MDFEEYRKIVSDVLIKDNPLNSNSASSYFEVISGVCDETHEGTRASSIARSLRKYFALCYGTKLSTEKSLELAEKIKTKTEKK